MNQEQVFSAIDEIRLQLATLDRKLGRQPNITLNNIEQYHLYMVASYLDALSYSIEQKPITNEL